MPSAISQTPVLAVSIQEALNPTSVHPEPDPTASAQTEKSYPVPSALDRNINFHSQYLLPNILLPSSGFFPRMFPGSFPGGIHAASARFLLSPDPGFFQ